MRNLFFILFFIVFSCKSDYQKPKIDKNKEKLEPVHLVIPNQAKKEFEPPLIDEKEPNDYPVYAQYLSIGVGARGYINKPWKDHGKKKLRADRDVFIFNIPGPGKKILWAKISGVPNIDIFMAVHKKHLDRVVIQDSNGVGKEEIIVNLTLKPGEYFFKVGERYKKYDKLYNLRQFYKLNWKISTPAPGDEIEPNDLRTFANNLILGKEVKGYLSSRKDYDNFNLPKNNNLLRIEYTPPKKLASWIYLRPKTGKTGYLKIPLDIDEKLILRRFKLSKLARILTIRPRNGKFSLNSKYALKVALEPFDKNKETEPNDLKPHKLTSENGKIDGFISYKNDIDLYSLELSSNSLITINLNSFQLGKLQFCIKAHKNICRKAKNRGENIEIHHQYLKKGKYIFEISGLNTYDPEQLYSLSWKTKLSLIGDEKEPNNRTGKSNRIKPGVPVRGYLTPVGDNDYYYFRVPGSLTNPPVIRVELTGGENINPVIILKDNNGNIVMEDKKGVYSGIRRIKTPIHPNIKYYIQIKDKRNSQQSVKVPYELRLEQINKK
jgi:hypothetical protein